MSGSYDTTFLNLRTSTARSEELSVIRVTHLTGVGGNKQQCSQLLWGYLML